MDLCLPRPHAQGWARASPRSGLQPWALKLLLERLPLAEKARIARNQVSIHLHEARFTSLRHTDW